MTVCGIVSCWPNIITRNTSTNKHVNSIESRELDSRNKNRRKSCKLRGYLVRLERLKFKNLMGTLRKMDDDRRNVFILIFNTNLRIFFISINLYYVYHNNILIESDNNIIQNYYFIVFIINMSCRNQINFRNL